MVRVTDRPMMATGHFGPIPVRTPGHFGRPDRFGPISEVGCFGPILVGRFGTSLYSVKILLKKNSDIYIV